jgi:hypothetical protein
MTPYARASQTPFFTGRAEPYVPNPYPPPRRASTRLVDWGTVLAFATLVGGGVLVYAIYRGFNASFGPLRGAKRVLRERSE